MNDATGREIEPNQKVVFTVGTKLVFGTVMNTRVRQYGETEYPIAKILLDTPEEIQRRNRGRWIRLELATPEQIERQQVMQYTNPEYIFVPDNPDAPRPAPRRTRDVYGSERIYILDNPEK